MRIAMVILTLLVAVPAWAAPSDATGRWAVRSNGRVLMIVTLAKAKSGWSGTWRRPKHFQADAGSEVKGPIVVRRLTSATSSGDALILVFGGARPSDRDAMRFRVLPDGTARMSLADAPDATLVFDRAGPADTPIAPDPTASYAIDQHWPTNAEMSAIFDADQADRAAPTIDWKLVRPRDQQRQARTRALLASGALASGTDFFHAAFVFQHSGNAADILLAHSLAIVAVARGERRATWIAAATLDRYLRDIGQKQVFGTQYRWDPTSPVTQDPYDRTLVSDALRLALGVPDQAAQDEERKRLEEARQPAAK